MSTNPTRPVEAADDAKVITPEDLEKFIDVFDKIISSSTQEVARIHAPLMEGSAELSRLFITLSGGALVATISIVQLITEKIQDATAGWLLVVSWVLFGLTIIFSILSLGAITRFRSIEYEAVTARNYFVSTDAAKSQDQMVAAIEQWNVHLRNLINTTARVHNSSRLAAALCFISAFAAVIASAIANFPL